MSNLHNLFPQKVRLEEESHQYFHQNGDEYVSFSKLFSFLSPKFDANNIAGHVGRSEGISKEAVLNKWQSQTDLGTRIDNALTLYSTTGQVLQEDAAFAPLIRAVLKKYEGYSKTYQQVVVYHEMYRVAGSLDKLSLVSNRKTSDFIISDFKAFEAGMSYEPKGTKWLASPFDYMQNTKYNKISFQCSYYAHLFEELTGRKCARLFVDLIIPKKTNGKLTGFTNEIVPLAYLKPQVELFLETFKDKILNLVQPQVLITETEEEF